MSVHCVTHEIKELMDLNDASMLDDFITSLHPLLQDIVTDGFVDFLRKQKTNKHFQFGLFDGVDLPKAIQRELHR